MSAPVRPLQKGSSVSRFCDIVRLILLMLFYFGPFWVVIVSGFVPGLHSIAIPIIAVWAVLDLLVLIPLIRRGLKR